MPIYTDPNKALKPEPRARYSLRLFRTLGGGLSRAPLGAFKQDVYG